MRCFNGRAPGDTRSAGRLRKYEDAASEVIAALSAVVIFEPTPIAGAFMIDIERRADERGFFARTWCRDEFASAGIPFDVAQGSLSHNRYAGTLRGLHYARPPAREGKLVRCDRGAVFDVIVDLRPASPSYLRHFSVVLDDEQRNALYVPPGVAHGFQTLADHSDVAYMMSEAYRPELAAGVRFDDPAFGIRWPRPVRSIVERDRTYADFDPTRHASGYGYAPVA